TSGSPGMSRVMSFQRWVAAKQLPPPDSDIGGVGSPVHAAGGTGTREDRSAAELPVAVPLRQVDGHADVEVERAVPDLFRVELEGPDRLRVQLDPPVPQLHRHRRLEEEPGARGDVLLRQAPGEITEATRGEIQEAHPRESRRADQLEERRDEPEVGLQVTARQPGVEGATFRIIDGVGPRAPIASASEQLPPQVF